jgi:16S rRNA (uracil1498-N3)-methyltransferase
MTRKCFFIDRIDPGEKCVKLTEEVSHHVESVLRLKSGDPVELRDGRGRAWQGVIADVKRGKVHIQVGSEQHLHNESSLKFTMALAFSRSDRMELVLRQATEIGVFRFVAFRAERSQYALSGPRLFKRKVRWSKIAREALCQCGRIKLPEICVVPDVPELISMASNWDSEGVPGLRILASEDGMGRGLLDVWRVSPVCNQVIGVVGPEGGWAQREVDSFLEAGFEAVHLGPRTLRMETAAIALSASIQLLWGDLRK